MNIISQYYKHSGRNTRVFVNYLSVNSCTKKNRKSGKSIYTCGIAINTSKYILQEKLEHLIVIKVTISNLVHTLTYVWYFKYNEKFVNIKGITIYFHCAISRSV